MDITVRLEFDVADNRESGGALLFTRWLPLHAADAVVVDDDGCRVRIWFDLHCVHRGNELAPAEIERHIGIGVTKAHVDVHLPGVADELVEFIYQERDRPRKPPEETPNDETYRQLASEYSALGQRVLRVATRAFNRLISYFRVYKGQFWLSERELRLETMASEFNGLNARVELGARGQVRWRPPNDDLFVLRSYGEDRYVGRDGWADVRRFVAGEARPDLVLELLANAERLARGGYRRSAIVEAVTALEVAVNRFAANPKLEKLRGSEMGRVLDAKSLKSRHKHLGFSASIKYLIPLLFPPTVLPEELIEKCNSALKIRGTVVHHGTRDVSQAKVDSVSGALRQTCAILTHHTGVQEKAENRP